MATTSWDQFIVMITHMAKHLASTPQEADELRQEGFISVYLALQQDPVLDNPTAYVRTVARRAMYAAKARNRTPRGQLSLDALTEEEVPITEQSDDVVAAYLHDLEDECGSKARWIAENLISPDDGLGRFLLLAYEKKQRGGGDVLRVTRKQTRLAMGLKWRRWHAILLQIQVFTVAWVLANDIVVNTVTNLR